MHPLFLRAEGIAQMMKDTIKRMLRNGVQPSDIPPRYTNWMHRFRFYCLPERTVFRAGPIRGNSIPVQGTTYWVLCRLNPHRGFENAEAYENGDNDVYE
jgi:hypothetical protein